MKGKKTFFAIALGFALLLAGACYLYALLSDRVETEQLGSLGPSGTGQQAGVSGNEQDRGPQSGSGEEPLPVVPDFLVYDRKGDPVRLHDHFGKPIVLNFWASWCGPCKSEMHEFSEACRKYGDEVHFFMVNMTDGAQETRKTADDYLDSSNYAFPVYYDEELQAAKAYQVYSLPTTYFIDARGVGIAYANSAIDMAVLEKGIGMILPG